MRLALILAALPLLAQQKLSSPVTVGGVNCGEIRLKEAFATGGSYSTLKACQDAFGEVTTSIIGATGNTTFTAYESGNILYGPQQFRPVGGADAKILIQHVSGNPELRIRDSFGTESMILRPSGITLDQQAFAPATPSTGDIVIYSYSGSGTLCSKDSTGVETCYGNGAPSNMVTTDTTQTITGTKTMQGPFYIQAPGGGNKFLFNSVSNRGIQQIYNSGGTVGVGLDAGTNEVFSNSSELKLSQYGDAIGDTSIVLQNRVGLNGGSINVTDVDLADWRMCGSSGQCFTMRHEIRSASGLTFLDPSKKELQFGDMNAYPGGIGFLVNVDGAGTAKGDYFRWLGASSGFVSVKAPATVTSYNMNLPATLGATGQALCVSNASTGDLGWCSTGGSASFETPVNFTTSGTTKASWSTISSRMLGQLYNASGTVGIRLDAGLSGGSATLELKDTATSSESIMDNNNLDFINSSGVTHWSAGSGASGGFLSLYTSSGNQAILMDGNGVGRIRVSDGTVLQTGLSTTVSVPCGTLTFTMGILTNKGTC